MTEKMTEPLVETAIAPNFIIETDNGGTFNLQDNKGRYVVLYFYPKDNTPGCTKQAIAFSEYKQEFAGLNATILGISPDSIKKHSNFRNKHDLTILLGADEQADVCQQYGVWQEKNMYGKKYMGVVRSTFIIDPEGKIAAIWRKVKVPGHIDAVLEKLQELQNA
ncbi:thioredoxin-dependent thiol peroxidase [Polycladidibacter stylochi]|uniref:thioredoxin-dependent thiol peroxidase n=1 Tax=Polycladidibacter stylochi TaxID=1807766 RepID=UPI000B109029|nr:thioredoxin-dependent thiol peroxidase [Pseudovibrio stylochi]